ncbi:MAG: hypothetical protein AB1487_12580 [Thermodesulfobacteriota bacterium]
MGKIQYHSEGKLRIGWSHQSTSDINQGRRDIIREQLAAELTHKGIVTRDINALRLICESKKEDIWITFYSSRLWWCRIGNNKVCKDKISKYLKVSKAWSDCDVHGTPLTISRISGRLAKIQGFRGTVCQVREKEDLRRLINDEPSPEYALIKDSKAKLVGSIEKGLKKLHWKDFETFVDLLFRQSGWRRITMVGETMKYVDIELEDPVTYDRYQVQVKSQANLSDFIQYAKEFGNAGYRKLYFAVHTAGKDLVRYDPNNSETELLLPNRLAEMAVDLGLVNWVLSKIK